MISKAEILQGLQLASERYYSCPLQRAGFINCKDDLLNWYRIENGVIAHLHIISTSSRDGIIHILFGIHPTYLPVNLVPGISHSHISGCFSKILFCGAIFFRYNCAVEPDVLFALPNTPSRGADRMEAFLFPLMDRLSNRTAVYQWHKKRAQNLHRIRLQEYPEYQFINELSTDFTDEAIVEGDESVFAPCVDLVKHELASRQTIRNRLSLRSISFRPESLLRAQLQALQTKDFKSYLELIRQREQRFYRKYDLKDSKPGDPSPHGICKQHQDWEYDPFDSSEGIIL